MRATTRPKRHLSRSRRPIAGCSSRLAHVIRRATNALEDYEYARARDEVEKFFWTELCDNYLELVKARLYGDASSATTNGHAPAGREAAQYTLYHTVLAVLKMLAPFMPHITEEIYLHGFAATDGASSIHLAQWPEAPESWANAEADAIGEAILGVAEGARRWKADRQLSVGAPVALLTVKAPANVLPGLEAAAIDLRSVTRAQEIAFQSGGEAVTLEIEAAEPQRA